jgi:hypothetical protein
MSFSGKNGTLFFFTVGFVLSAEKLINIQTRGEKQNYIRI